MLDKFMVPQRKEIPSFRVGFCYMECWPILLCSKVMPRNSRAPITMKKVQPSSFHKQQVLPELNEGKRSDKFTNTTQKRKLLSRKFKLFLNTGAFEKLYGSFY